jgi:hypothetical protein
MNLITTNKIDKILYELNGKYENIKNIIVELNNLGFYTAVSQPGKHDCWYDDNKKKLYDRRQRSYVFGYMKSQMASFLIEQFNNTNNPNLFFRSTNNNKILNPMENCTCGSVEFENDLSCTMDFNSGDFSQSFNFTLPLRRPYKDFVNVYKFITDNIDETDLIEFDILDLRWNNNEMWDELLSFVNKYHGLLVY